MTAVPLLKVENLQTHLHLRRGVVKAVDGISFEVHEGETLGIVGEFGSGKTMTCLSILHLLPTGGGGRWRAASSSTARTCSISTRSKWRRACAARRWR